MIKVSVMYPKGDDTTFDIEYYKTTHMDIVERTMKPAKIEIDSGNDRPWKCELRAVALYSRFLSRADAVANRQRLQQAGVCD